MEDFFFKYKEIIESLSKERVQELVRDAKDYMISSGGLLALPDKLQPYDFLLFPTPWPKRLFNDAWEVQKDFNLLVHKVSHDFRFVKEALKSVIEVDEFIRRHVEMYEEAASEGITQPIQMGILRSDYMISCDVDDVQLQDCRNNNKEIKLAQVELNTTSCGGFTMTEILHDLGSFILGKLEYTIDVGSKEYPDNAATAGIAEGLASAWEMYGNTSAVILTVAEYTDTFRFDQKAIEHHLHHRKPRIKTIRRSLSDLKKCASLGENKKLIVDGHEVAVAYYRSGYSPNCYKSEDEWDARLLIERSMAIKCPNIIVQLIGAKKIQQVFAKPGVIERFISDEKAVKRIRDTFTGLYSLDKDAEGEAAFQLAVKNPDRYVLKPQREGGGNNIFGEDIKKTLQSITPDERAEYILMDKIRTPSVKNYFILTSADEPVPGVVSSELGVCGVYISHGDSLLVNRQTGILMRSKDMSVNEGGAILGFTTKDTPYLF